METVDHPSLTMLLERSRSVRAESLRLAARYAEIREGVALEWRRSLTETTTMIDAEAVGHPVMQARLTRLSARLGRSPDIERAKGMLAERFGITRAEAFAILRSISSHSNRKLRDVAAELVHGSPEGEHATLIPPG